MAGGVVGYDRPLPEIPGRRSWEEPNSFLVKDPALREGWRVESAKGRRPSPVLIVARLREAVDKWRADGYPRASAVTAELFRYWFDTAHTVNGIPGTFRYHFCQREAIETLVYLLEIADKRDAVELIKAFGPATNAHLLVDEEIQFQTRINGQRFIRRYVPEVGQFGDQDLPPQDLARYAFKLATGTGKTWVMAMAIVWSYFHRKRIEGSRCANNFLVVAPNVIVYQRLEKDFANGKIFADLPLIPQYWKPTFALKVILRSEPGEPDPAGTLFLTNVQQLYPAQGKEWRPKNPADVLLGRKPAGDLAAERPVFERIASVPNLAVLNDEAHHVHDVDLSWNRALMTLHRRLRSGLALWLDFSATPKDQSGMTFPWTVCDYPLAQAVEDRIVKAPIIVTRENDPKRPEKEPERVTKENVAAKYGYWIHAAVARWREHFNIYQRLRPPQKPVLFIMAEKNPYADAIGAYLQDAAQFKFQRDEVLVIHTDRENDVANEDLDALRDLARNVDSNKVKVIVSVMMLREGWDVRNVTVVLGLRPFTAKAEILPEQVIGRGLRLIPAVSPDRTQTLEVLGTEKLLDVLRDQLEAEGVSVPTEPNDPKQPIVIEPIQERKPDYDIKLPITAPTLSHDYRKLDGLKAEDLEPIYDQRELKRSFSIRLQMEFGTVSAHLGVRDVAWNPEIEVRHYLNTIANRTMKQAGLTGRFREIYELVKRYVTEICFGGVVPLDDSRLRKHLGRPELQEGIVGYLARRIGEQVLEHKTLTLEGGEQRLSNTSPFVWRRNLPPYEAERTVFSAVATYNNYERVFGEFLDHASDVLRFASLATTEQGDSGVSFKIDYLKPSGAIGFYYPDWIVVRKVAVSADNPAGEENWIIETKGRVWDGTERKDEAMREWCERVSSMVGRVWKFVRVNQTVFDAGGFKNLGELVTLVGREAHPVFLETD